MVVHNYAQVIVLKLGMFVRDFLQHIVLYIVSPGLLSRVVAMLDFEVCLFRLFGRVVKSKWSIPMLAVCLCTVVVWTAIITNSLHGFQA